MKYNSTTYSLVKRAVVEARIRKWFKGTRKKNPSPSKLLTKLLKPKKGIHVQLTRRERKSFIKLIHEMYIAKDIISKYRKKYSRKPKLFYKKVFGFPPRKFQKMKIIWNSLNIHFIFRKNDLIAFTRKVRWGPGIGGYYSVGDIDIKIKDLRGLVSFGKEEDYSIETMDIMRHESVHAFEDLIKKRRQPYGKKSLMFYGIKTELNACLHNFKYSKKRKRRKINKWARLGLGLQVKENIEDYLSYNETVKRIKNLKIKIKRTKNKRTKTRLRKRLNKLKERLEKKKERRKIYFSLYRKTTNQVKKALRIMPIEVLQRIVYETPYERLYKKIPESVRVYKKMLYEWYNN